MRNCMNISEKTTFKGALHIKIFRRGELIEEQTYENMVVNGARTTMAMLLGGDGLGKTVNRVGFGTNGINAAPEDTALTDGYTTLLDAATYPEPGKVCFAWSLAGEEANDMIIREFGLLSEDGTLFARKVRAPIEKTPDICLSGAWTITF